MELTKAKVREIQNAQLTDREITVLWLGTGKIGRREVAEMLGISETRVSMLKTQIDKKLKQQGWAE